MDQYRRGWRDALDHVRRGIRSGLQMPQLLDLIQELHQAPPPRRDNDQPADHGRTNREDQDQRED